MERPCIDSLLEDAIRIRKPLIKVIAGAGYGKTEAVYSFLKKNVMAVAWVQLSDRDNLGAKFWENFARAAFSLNEPCAAKLLELGFPETEGDFERYLSLIEYEMGDNFRYVKVFDDFHLIRDQSVMRFVEKSIITRLPGATTILISRTEPPINTITLLSKGCVVEIGEEQLRFSKDETTRYFQTRGIQVSPKVLSDIYDLTEGWAFAINLIRLSLTKNPARGDYRAREDSALSEMKRNIFRLIERDIFSGISETMQKFLIKLSLVDHLSLDFIKSLAPDENAIWEITRAGSFIRYDSYLDACHIHHLLLDYLTRKQHLLTDDEKREVYVKAVQWCVNNDYKMDAVSYCEKIGDYEKIIEIVGTMSQALSRNIALFMLDIFKNIPQDIYDKYVFLYVLYARFLLCAEKIDEARAEMYAIVEKFEALPESPSSCLALFGSYNHLGISYYLKYMFEHNSDFWRYFEKSFHYYPRSGFVAKEPVTDNCVGTYACRVGCAEKGNIEKFTEAMEKTVSYVSVTVNGCMYGLDDLIKAEAEYYKDRLKNCEKFAYQALSKAREKRQHEIENRALYYLMCSSVADGNYTAVQEILKQLKWQLDEAGYINRYTLYDIVTGWYYTAVRDAARVAPWLKSGFDKSGIDSCNHGFENIVKLKYHLLEKKYHALLAFMETREAAFGLKSFLYGKVSVKIYESICFHQLNGNDEAMKTLAEAYEIASPNALDMLFIEQGNGMRSLAAAAIKHGQKNVRYAVPLDWLEKIQTKSATYAKRLAYVTSEYRKANYPGSGIQLTDIETDVLTDLSRGLSRTEIAAGRDLSVNIVRATLQMIRAKLGAEDGQEAIRMAASLKLLK